MTRRFWIRAHLWLGLSLGIFWALQGITGALLVFHRELDRVGGPELSEGPMLPPSALIASAQRGANQPIQRLTAVSNDERLIEARYNDAQGKPQAIQLDAASGRIVGEREREPVSPFTGSGWRWLYLLHISLLAGPVGRILIGISGLVLAVTVAVGLYVGWPRARTWGVAFSPKKWRTTLQKLYGWHRGGGLATGLMLILLGVSGCYMTFATRLAPSLAALSSFDPVATMSHQMGHGASHDATAILSPDDAFAIARREFRQGKFMNLELPVEHPGYYSVRFTLPDEWRRWSGRAMVRIDANTGAIISRYDPGKASLGNRIDDSIYPFHMGEALGPIGRIATAIVGLTLPAFLVTGYIRWRRRKRTQARNRGLVST